MLIAGLIVDAVGCVFLFLGIFFWVTGKKNWKDPAVTNGRIVDMCLDNISYKKAFLANTGDSDGFKTGISGVGEEGTAFPVFSYTVNGVEYRTTGNVAYERRLVRKRIGQDCMVYYDPQDPRRASLSKTSALAVLGKIFVIVGLFLISFGIPFLCMR